jgi:hypothetical protein
VLSVIMVLLGTVYPLGAILQGSLADHIGLRVTTACAGLLLGAAVLSLRLLRPGFTAALDGAVDAGVATPVASAPA